MYRAVVEFSTTEKARDRERRGLHLRRIHPASEEPFTDDDKTKEIVNKVFYNGIYKLSSIQFKLSQILRNITTEW